METHKSVIASEKRAKSAIMLVYITTVAFIATQILSIINHLFSDDNNLFRFEFPLPWQDAETGTDMFLFVDFSELADMGYGLIYIVSAITFIMWFWRAYGNLRALSADQLYAQGWTIGCWFIPFVNLYLPYQIMKSMFGGLNRELMKNEQANKPTTRVSTSSLGIWWGLWIFVFLLSNFEMRGMVLFTSTMGMIIDLILLVLFFGLASYTVEMIEEYVRAENILLSEDDEENRFSDIIS